MNIEEPDPTPGRSPEPAPGDPQGERRPSRPRRPRGGESAPQGEGGRAPEPRERRGERGGGDRRDRGPRGERSERGGRPGGRGRSGEGERGPRAKAGGEPSQPAPAKQPAAATGDGSPGDPGGDLLASVSRSFSLTIRLLPEPLREPITVGYLLARAQDTVADTPDVPAATRLEHLRALLEMVRYGADAEVLPTLQRALVAKQKHDGERDLIKQLGGCLARLEALPADDRWELRRTLARIGYAQELDLLRFGEGTSAEPKTLASAAELDEYTYLIAGCVGELWTRLCQRHLPAGWSKLGEDDMLKLGKRFGQGLQMVNILRDLPEDLANGRCYLPADLLTEHGLTAGDLTKQPARARALLDTLRLRAVEHLDAGWSYVLALSARKLRYATALPVLIGLETLGLLARTSPLESTERLKVSRSSMRGLMASAAVGAALAPWLNRLHGKLRQRAVGAK